MKLKSFHLSLLDIGESTLIGPFRSATSPAAKIRQQVTADPDLAMRRFTQQQRLLVDPKTCRTVKMYLITRVA